MKLTPESSSQRKLIRAAECAADHLPAHIPPALFLTDPLRTPDPVSIAERIPAGWGVIYRHFNASNRREIADQLAKLARIRGLRLIIAADPELAESVKADGVHWPHKMITEAETWRTAFPLMTASAHSEAELLTASGHDVDALLLSTVFASGSSSARAPIGAPNFAALRASMDKPVFALGGINSDTVEAIAPAPFAAISGISDAFALKT